MAGYSGQIATNLEKFQALGQQQGRQNLPSTNAIANDSNEMKLESEAMRFVLDEHSAFIGKVNELDKQIVVTEQKFSELQINCETMLNDNSLALDIEQHLAQEKHSLVDLRASELKLLSDMRGFKVEHNLSSEAHYPKDNLLHLSWIFLCIAIETVINAFFFENQNGLLGGAVVALAISVVNLGSAGVLGYFFRYKNHHDVLAQSLGWLCVVFFFFITVYMNAVFSAFRYEYQLVADPSELRETANAFRTAISHAVTIFYFNIPFNDILSFVLFFIGCLLGGYAFYKGYTFDDPYPGYGARDRRHKLAAERVVAAELEIRERLRVILERKKGDIIALKNTLTGEGIKVAQMEAAINGFKNEILVVLQRIQNDFSAVLDIYRRSNTAVRSTPVPPYFESIVDLRVGYSNDAAGPVAEHLSRAKVSYEKLRNSNLDKLSSRIMESSRHSTQILGEQFNSFLGDVLNEAHKKIANEQQVLDELSVRRN